MSGTTTIRYDAKDLHRLHDAFNDLGGTEKDVIVARIINRGGDTSFTRVKRTLSKEVGLTQANTVRYGGLRKSKAAPGRLNYSIHSRGKSLPLKMFNARQVRRGVSHKAWGKRTTNAGAFIVASLGGHVFSRTGAARLPIEKQYGPTIPLELKRGESQAVMNATMAEIVPKRIPHEMKRYFERVKRRHAL